ncbi:hypothetical protein [Planococcus sp. CAU13]|uniref:hypothetical protein n=1 Tax=Planococcus sp. CAU13 TaxID=1541197 RepID=UPI001269E6EC|nr:hypothetical protein [Planococcus sp. CAU13]
MVTGSDGNELKVAPNFSTTNAVLYDALYAVGGSEVSKAFAKNAAKYLGEASTITKRLVLQKKAANGWKLSKCSISRGS